MKLIYIIRNSEGVLERCIFRGKIKNDQLYVWSGWWIKANGNLVPDIIEHETEDEA